VAYEVELLIRCHLRLGRRLCESPAALSEVLLDRALLLAGLLQHHGHAVTLDTIVAVHRALSVHPTRERMRKYPPG